MGGTADDILRQANGYNPSYRAADDKRTVQQMNEDRIREQMRNDPAYNPSLRNGVSSNQPLDRQQALLSLVQNFANEDNDRPVSNGSSELAIRIQPFTDALQVLKNMLSGTQKLSVAEAYFRMENAYGQCYLTWKEFTAILQQSNAFIKAWMQQNKLNYSDNAAKHYALQKFMSERETITIVRTIKDNGKVTEVITHDPFFYDYDDYTGAKDHRDFYVSKCLATGMGQCNSLPAVYLSLAEGIGATAYLAHAPQHSLIKYPDNNGKPRNYEPTSNWDISDQWYLDNMFVSKKAQQTGIYLDPMTSKQVVADCALQLAFGFHRKFGTLDGKFIMACIDLAKPYFPKDNNISLYLTYSNLYGYELGRLMRARGMNRLAEIPSDSETNRVYQLWLANEDKIEALGYEETPQGLYEEMMKYHEFRGHIQEGYHVSGKSKHTLFTESTLTQ